MELNDRGHGLHFLEGRSRKDTLHRAPVGAVRIIFDMAPPGSTEFKTYLEGSARKR